MNGATPKSRSLAGRAAKIVSCGDQTAGEAPTPFYDQLMSMIHATALENRRAGQPDVGDAVSHAAHPWWRVHPLIPCIAGLIVIAATGRSLLAPEVSQRQPPVVTAAADNAPKERSRVVDKAATPDELAERPVPPAEPDGLERSGVEGKRTAEGRIGAESVAAAKSGERPLDATGMPIANPKSEQPPPGDAPSPIETASVKRADDPPAIRTARVVSDVNMRAGPSNGQSVLATLSRGSTIEVINCRQWCEVIFADQRGWVHRSFIAGH
jgi:Bacterial SH3 domain